MSALTSAPKKNVLVLDVKDRGQTSSSLPLTIPVSAHVPVGTECRDLTEVATAGVDDIEFDNGFRDRVEHRHKLSTRDGGALADECTVEDCVFDNLAAAG